MVLYGLAMGCFLAAMLMTFGKGDELRYAVYSAAFFIGAVLCWRTAALVSAISRNCCEKGG